VRTVLWLLVGVLVVVLFLVAAQESGAIAGLSQLDISSLGLNIVLVVFIVVLVVALLRDRLSRIIASGLIWIVIVGVLALGYTYRFELRDVSDRVMAEFVPGHAASSGQKVQIARDSGGNFLVQAHVNGARLPMVLDTGASSVVLTQQAAKAAGLPIEVLSYTVHIDTANGRTRAAPVTLDRISVGNIVERAVPALIAQPGQLRVNLLGMSFLNRLARWEVRGDRLMLQGYP
jgi:aspartyl protease family protein